MAKLSSRDELDNLIYDAKIEDMKPMLSAATVTIFAVISWDIPKCLQYALEEVYRSHVNVESALQTYAKLGIVSVT